MSKTQVGHCVLPVLSVLSVLSVLPLLNRLRPKSGLMLWMQACYNIRVRSVLLVQSAFRSLYVLLYHPWRVLQICVLVAAANLIFDGSLFRFFGLHSDLRSLQTQIQQTQADIEHIQHQKQQSTQSNFIQLQAINRFNLAHQNDLVFVFSGDE